MRALAPPGGAVVVESPTYRGALAAVRAAGLTPVPVPSDADGVRPALLADALERTGARVAYLQPLHANPHGADLSAERRAEVMAIAARAGAFLIEDDWARDLTIDGPAPAPLAADDADGHVVYVRSLSKGAVAGAAGRRRSLRAGRPARGCAPPGWSRTCSSARRCSTRRSSSSPHPAGGATCGRCARACASAATRSPARSPSTSGPARCGACRAAGCTCGCGCPDGTDEAGLVAAAARAGVLVSGCGPSFAAEPTGPHLRLTFGGAPPDVLVEGAGRLAGAAALGVLELGARRAHRRVRVRGLTWPADEEAEERAGRPRRSRRRPRPAGCAGRARGA